MMQLVVSDLGELLDRRDAVVAGLFFQWRVRRRCLSIPSGAKTGPWVRGRLSMNGRGSD
jgi:hypothetical protein